MSILSGPEIREEIKAGSISIDPYVEENIGENSVDLRLGNELVWYAETVLDTRKEPTRVIRKKIPDNGLVLEQNKLYLGYTEESVWSNKYVSHITGRSSIGRLGLTVHVTAGLVDVGFKGQITLEMIAAMPIRIYPGDRICCLIFQEVVGELEQYSGRYMDQTGPVASRGHMDEFGSFQGTRK